MVASNQPAPTSVACLRSASDAGSLDVERGADALGSLSGGAAGGMRAGLPSSDGFSKRYAARATWAKNRSRR